jgi:hypothetical protein
MEKCNSDVAAVLSPNVLIINALCDIRRMNPPLHQGTKNQSNITFDWHGALLIRDIILTASLIFQTVPNGIVVNPIVGVTFTNDDKFFGSF